MWENDAFLLVKLATYSESSQTYMIELFGKIAFLTQKKLKSISFNIYPWKQDKKVSVCHLQSKISNNKRNSSTKQ